MSSGHQLSYTAGKMEWIMVIIRQISFSGAICFHSLPSFSSFSRGILFPLESSTTWGRRWNLIPCRLLFTVPDVL